MFISWKYMVNTLVQRCGHDSLERSTPAHTSLQEPSQDRDADRFNLQMVMWAASNTPKCVAQPVTDLQPLFLQDGQCKGGTRRYYIDEMVWDGLACRV